MVDIEVQPVEVPDSLHPVASPPGLLAYAPGPVAVGSWSPGFPGLPVWEAAFDRVEV